MLHDLGLAFRALRRSPGFAGVAILTLALGIGANTAIFSVVDGVLLRRAPVDDLERLVVVWETDRNSHTIREPASVPDYLDFVARSRTVGPLAAVMSDEVNLTPPAGEPVRLAALRITHGLLPMLGIRPIAGRSFTEDEDRARGPAVAMISESLWERSFGRDPGVLGRTLRLDEQPYSIVSVAPEVADFGVLQILSGAAYSRGFADRGDRVRVDVWLPLQPDPESSPRSTHPIFVLGRLAPGAGLGAAQQELSAISADLERAYPENAARGVFIEPLGAVVFGPVRPALLVLLGAVGLVALVACVNVASLLLARGAARAREVAVRTALGAGGGHLARQFFAESAVLTLVAAAAGVAFAYGGLRALLAIAPPDVPRLSAVAIDLRVLAATLGLASVVALAFGLVPTLQARGVDVQTTLKSEGAGAPGLWRARGRLRSALVVAELALAVVLVVGAGLLIKSFWRLQQVDPGFRPTGVLKAEYQLPASRYPVDFRVWPDFKEMHAFTSRLLSRAATLPGVEEVGIAGNHPLDPGFTNSFTVVGREAEARTWPEISVRRVSPGYFRTVGLALQRGRLVGEMDVTAGQPVALVNEAAAHRFFGDRDPLGERIAFWGAARTIVGIVANEKFQGLSETAPIAVYVPIAQAPSASGAGVLLVRASVDAEALASAVRGAIRDVDPALAVFGVEALDSTVARSISQRRFTMLLVGLFAAVALVLAAVGVHGVLSYTVAQRTREIGIRMALGARPGRVVGLVVGQGLVLALVGLALGFAGAVGLTRALERLLFGVTPTDPATYLAVGGFLALVALGASYIPARRAANVDPLVALREG